MGTHGRNGDILVMTTQGVIKGNTVHRKPESERWDRSELAELKGVPGRFARGVLKIWSIGSTSSARDNTEVDSHYERWRTKTALCEKEGPGEGRWNDGLYTRVQRMRGTHGWTACSCTQLACRGRLEQRLAETEEGRKRLADVEKRLEEGKEKKAKQAVKGLPDPTEGEVRSSVALGQPEAEEGETSSKRSSEGTEGERTGKRTKAKAREKRPGTSLDDLYYDEIGDVGPRIVSTGEPTGTQAEPPAASAGGAASSSSAGPAAGPNPPDITTGERDGTPAGYIQGTNIQSLCQLTCESSEDELTKQELLALGAHEVTEVFSPLGVTATYKKYELLPGYAIDLEIGWDLTSSDGVKSIRTTLQEEDPYLVTGSPPCEAFSPLRALDERRVDRETKALRLEVGKDILKTICESYKQQMKRGRYFLHEHQKNAKSWGEKCVKEIAERDDVFVVEGPMCGWGMKASGKSYVREMTKWMTN